MIDFNEFLKNNDNTIFRMYKYKKLYTPYEQDKKYSDETIYENGNYPTYVYIREAIQLPDNDILLKLEETAPLCEQNSLDNENKFYIYEKLSDICIKESEYDNK